MAFVAAAVAKTGDMKIETPTATLGIRGTTGVVEVPEGATAAANANNVGIKLYPDADGRVGRIDVRGRDGAPLGMLTQGASGFTVRGTMVPGFGMRMSAMPMVMSAQMIARDRGFTQRVHTMQGIGRGIVLQQRNFRIQNPNRPPAFGRPGFNQGGQRGGFNQPGGRFGNQPGNRLGNQPGLNQPGQRGQQPGLNQPGQRGQPGMNRPGQLNQPGQRTAPDSISGTAGSSRPEPARSTAATGSANPPGQRGSLQPRMQRQPGLANQPGPAWSGRSAARWIPATARRSRTIWLAAAAAQPAGTRQPSRDPATRHAGRITAASGCAGCIRATRCRRIAESSRRAEPSWHSPGANRCAASGAACNSGAAEKTTAASEDQTIAERIAAIGRLIPSPRGVACNTRAL